MTLTPQWLDELRARTTLSTLLGRTIKLQKAGREYRACCPFHNEKTPSFYVNDEKGFYHCFGCGAHGDAIRWMTDQRGLPFMEAVKELAAQAGMDVPAPDPRGAERAERQAGLHDAMAAAQAFFTDQLAGSAGGEARDYLASRGIRPETVKAFGLGFAPDSRNRLKAGLASYGDPLLVEAGLLIEVEGKEPYDRFRGRLMIPIRDARGRVIAFGGRILGAGEPKYLNSPETPLFDKGRTLYNLDRAAPASRKAGRIIVVEGYMDVIALAQAGIDEAVAPLGTALTEAQLERLWRLHERPILCFDGDAAGQRAAMKAAARALPFLAPDRTLRFLTLPAGKDPDDVIREGGRDAVETLLAEPEPLVDRLWHAERDAEPLDTPEARAGLRRRLQEHAQAIRDPDVRQHYQAEFRRRADLLFAPPPFVHGRRAFAERGGKWQPPARPASAEAKRVGSSGVDPLLARTVLAGLVRHPAVIADHAESLAGLRLDDPALERLREALLDAAYSGETLEGARVDAILTQAGLAALAKEGGGANGLAFSFLRDDADPATAAADLGEAIDILVTRPRLDAALAEATARLKTRTDEPAFREQQRLFAARAETEMRLVELVRAAGGDW